MFRDSSTSRTFDSRNRYVLWLRWRLAKEGPLLQIHQSARLLLYAMVPAAARLLSRFHSCQAGSAAGLLVLPRRFAVAGLTPPKGERRRARAQGFCCTVSPSAARTDLR